MKRDGYRIFAIEQSLKSTPYYKLQAKGHKLENVALIVGNEVNGIHSSILKMCDKVLEIPMKGSKESLNVSVAFGIVAFHLVFARAR